MPANLRSPRRCVDERPRAGAGRRGRRRPRADAPRAAACGRRRSGGGRDWPPPAARPAGRRARSPASHGVDAGRRQHRASWPADARWRWESRWCGRAGRLAARRPRARSGSRAARWRARPGRRPGRCGSRSRSRRRRPAVTGSTAVTGPALGGRRARQQLRHRPGGLWPKRKSRPVVIAATAELAQQDAGHERGGGGAHQAPVAAKHVEVVDAEAAQQLGLAAQGREARRGGGGVRAPRADAART